MITQFVDDLLVAIGEATVDELRELFAQTPSGVPLFESISRPMSAPTSSPAVSEGAGRTDHRATLRRSIEASLLSAIPLAVAEITDPESLLSLGNPNGPMGVSSRRSEATQANEARPVVALLHRSWTAQAHAEPEADSPASEVRSLSTGPTVRLSDNETLARVSNSGVVIRRKKKG